jgi:hypothetical protein
MRALTDNSFSQTAKNISVQSHVDILLYWNELMANGTMDIEENQPIASLSPLSGPHKTSDSLMMRVAPCFIAHNDRSERPKDD